MFRVKTRGGRGDEDGPAEDQEPVRLKCRERCLLVVTLISKFNLKLIFKFKQSIIIPSDIV